MGPTRCLRRLKCFLCSRSDSLSLILRTHSKRRDLTLKSGFLAFTHMLWFCAHLHLYTYIIHTLNFKSPQSVLKIPLFFPMLCHPLHFRLHFLPSSVCNAHLLVLILHVSSFSWCQTCSLNAPSLK